MSTWDSVDRRAPLVGRRSTDISIDFVALAQKQLQAEGKFPGVDGGIDVMPVMSAAGPRPSEVKQGRIKSEPHLEVTHVIINQRLYQIGEVLVILVLLATLWFVSTGVTWTCYLSARFCAP